MSIRPEPAGKKVPEQLRNPSDAPGRLRLQNTGEPLRRDEHDVRVIRKKVMTVSKPGGVIENPLTDDRVTRSLSFREKDPLIGDPANRGSSRQPTTALCRRKFSIASSIASSRAYTGSISPRLVG